MKEIDMHPTWEPAGIPGYLRCSACKDVYILSEWFTDGKWNFCPNCGEKLKEKA